MNQKTNPSQCYDISNGVIAKDVEGQIIIVRLIDGIGSIEDELYSLNKTGKDIWNLLDGRNTVKDIIKKLSTIYDAQAQQIESDVIDLVTELYEKGILIEVSG